jgi:hypothetical protein
MGPRIAGGSDLRVVVNLWGKDALGGGLEFRNL